MKEKVKALKAAFPYTIPVLTGFTLLGIAYGVLMNSKGYGLGWTSLMSLMVYAGAAQYVGISFLTSAFNPMYALLMTLMVNARHIFYGISMLDRYRNAGKLKPYLIFALCDETFSIICSANPEKDIDENWFNFFITMLNHLYWIVGSMIGVLIGSFVSFDTKGLDFVLTALFVSIFVGQWKNKKGHKASLVGVISSLVCLILFGPTNFIIPAMILILLILTIIGKKEIGDGFN